MNLHQDLTQIKSKMSNSVILTTQSLLQQLKYADQYYALSFCSSIVWNGQFQDFGQDNIQQYTDIQEYIACCGLYVSQGNANINPLFFPLTYQERRESSC
ncbi:hypothetical protein ABPG74_014327 [Tetrahymena malaccensis]